MMKTLNHAVVLSLLLLTRLSAQNPEWMSYTYGKNIQALAMENDLIWVGTNAGVVKINRISGETGFYDKFNTGLLLDEVRSVAVSKNGDKWIGRWYDSGVIQFDGANWKSFGGLDRIFAIVFDEKQNVWVGSEGWGMEKLELSFGTVRATRYTKSNSGLPNNYIQTLAFDKIGNLWIGTDPGDGTEATTGGLVKFDGKNWTVYNKSNSGLPINRIWSFAIDKKSNMWIGTYGGGLANFSGTNWAIYDKSNSPLPSNDITAVAVDSVGNIWVGTWLHGLAKFDGTMWASYSTANSGLPSNAINCLAVDASGDIWIGTNYGLTKFDGARWQAYNTSNSVLPGVAVATILTDKRGNLWMGTWADGSRGAYYGGGLVKFDGADWSIVPPQKLRIPHNQISCLALDWSGNLWIGSYSNVLIKFNPTNQESNTFIQPTLVGHPFSSIVIDLLENVWLGTDGKGVAKFDRENWEFYNTSNSGLPSDKVYALARDAGGNLWIGTNKGLAKFDQANSWAVYNRANSPLPCDTVFTIVPQKNKNLWIGTDAGGLVKFDGKNWMIYNPSNSGLPSLTVSAIVADDDNTLWIGTRSYYGSRYYEGGLAKFDGRKWTKYRYANSGLPSADVFAIAIDKNGNKWIGANRGVAVFREGGVKLTTTSSIYDLNLLQNFPNPFNFATRINYSLSQPDYVDIKIYNLIGQVVKNLVNRYESTGEYSVLWDGKNDYGFNLASGIYFCQIKSGERVMTRKILLSK